jgi:hypothetical protein
MASLEFALSFVSSSTQPERNSFQMVVFISPETGWLETWISQQYNHLLGQGGSKKECWAYVCHCVREIFAALHQARLPGCSFQSADEQSVSVMWGALIAHKKVEELTKKQFSAHPLLSHVLNLHLRQHSVRKVDHEVLTAKVNLLEKELAKVQKMADQAGTHGKQEEAVTLPGATKIT